MSGGELGGWLAKHDIFGNLIQQYEPVGQSNPMHGAICYTGIHSET